MLFRFQLALCVALVVTMTLLAGVVYAIGNPDEVSIQEAYVFSSVIEAGDQLFYVRYNVNYTTDPDEDAGDTWQVALYNATTMNLVASIPLNYYQNNVISIYLNSDLAVVSGAPHVIRVMGMPSVFGSLIEDVNMDTYTFSPGDYIDGDLIGSYMVTEAGVLEDLTGLTLLTEGDKLNDTGATLFLTGIPGLNSMDPSIFQTTVRCTNFDYTDYNETYSTTLTSGEPPSLSNAVSGVSEIFGIDSTTWSSAWLMGILFIVIGAPVYAGTRQATWALIVPFPVMLLFAWLGLGGGEFLRGLLLLVLVLGIVFAVTSVLRHFG